MNQYVIVREPGGCLLAESQLSLREDGTAILVPARSHRQDLFQYFFLKHGREVAVECNDITIRGTLRTRMDGSKRVWSLTLRRSQPAHAATTVTTTAHRAVRHSPGRRPAVPAAVALDAGGGAAISQR